MPLSVWRRCRVTWGAIAPDLALQIARSRSQSRVPCRIGRPEAEYDKKACSEHGRRAKKPGAQLFLVSYCTSREPPVCSKRKKVNAQWRLRLPLLPRGIPHQEAREWDSAERSDRFRNPAGGWPSNRGDVSQRDYNEQLDDRYALRAPSTKCIASVREHSLRLIRIGHRSVPGGPVRKPFSFGEPCENICDCL